VQPMAVKNGTTTIKGRLPNRGYHFIIEKTVLKAYYFVFEAVLFYPELL